MRQITKSAIIWSYSNQAVKAFGQIVVNLILMRLIVPSIFGQVAMVAVVVGFLEMFKSFKTEISLVHKSAISEQEKTSLFWFNGGLGILMAFFLLMISPLISHFYNEPSLIFISLWFSVSLAINGFNTIPFALFQKKMDFKKLFIIDTTSLIISSLVSIGLVLNGYPLESLLSRVILGALVPFICCVFIYGERQNFRFVANDIKPHLKFGLPVLGDSILNYGVRNLDNLLIGKYLGKFELGLYSRSYSLLLFPLSSFSSTLSQIILPVFSERQRDLDYIKATYLKTTRLLSMLTFPLMLFVFLSAPDIVSLFLGPHWLGTVPLIKVFALLGAAQSIGTLDGSVFQALGNTRIQLQVGIITKTFMMAMIVVGFLIYGTVLAIAVFYAIASFLAVFVGWYFLGPLFNSSLREMLFNLFPSFLLSVSTFGVVDFVGHQIGLEGIQSLFFNFVAVISVFLLTCKTFYPNLANEMVFLTKSVLCKK